MSEWTEQSRLVAANFHELEAKFYSTGTRIAASFRTREAAFEYARESRRHSDFAAMHRVESVRLRPNPNWVSVGPEGDYFSSLHADAFRSYDFVEYLIDKNPLRIKL